MSSQRCPDPSPFSHFSGHLKRPFAFASASLCYYYSSYFYGCFFIMCLFNDFMSLYFLLQLLSMQWKTPSSPADRAAYCAFHILSAAKVKTTSVHSVWTEHDRISLDGFFFSLISCLRIFYALFCLRLRFFFSLMCSFTFSRLYLPWVSFDSGSKSLSLKNVMCLSCV